MHKARFAGDDAPTPVPTFRPSSVVPGVKCVTSCLIELNYVTSYLKYVILLETVCAGRLPNMDSLLNHFLYDFIQRCTLIPEAVLKNDT